MSRPQPPSGDPAMSVCLQSGLRLGALLLAALTASAPAARARQEAAPDPETRAEAAVDALKQAVDDRDAARIQLALREFQEVYGQVQPKTVKKIGGAVTHLFKEYEPRVEYDLPPTAPLPGDEPQVANTDSTREVMECYTLAIGVMHDKPEGADVLLPLLKLKHVKQMPRITALVVEGLGYQRDPALTKTLAGFLSSDDAEVAGAAAGALAQLQDHPHAERLAAVKALIAACADVEKAVAKELRRTKEDEPRPAAERLARVEVPFGEALKTLTRQRFDTPGEWVAWFEEHGKESDW